ncbi:segregation and condensation protein A [Romboutsia lituseburensis]|uniref:segregation and condensation protein A n=1 Tax=Romboutsia lituseburensis TaxID=1537 RepID=UPI00215A4B92|nr:segregation/condensation protein A [Romboutsia lituseburensis]MCR8745144.1 segregation/condensation protein A [Romboutsia lituseburensis]
MKYNIQLQVYEGPLDLLYDLISKHKIDIKDISIIDITKQYLNYLEMLEKMDLEITSEFIIMASKLLEIKSKYLLYKQKEDEEEDPRLELMEQLEEYKRFKVAAENLKDNVNYINELYYRTKEEIVIDEKLDLESISIEAIKNILPRILKVRKQEEEISDDKLKTIVRTKIISVEEKINYIRNIINKEDEVRFTKIIKTSDKNEVIATFLSILELIKGKEIVVEQDIFFDDILIKKNAER